MTELTQSEADHLLALDKVAANARHRVYPGIGGKLDVPLRSRDGHERFWLERLDAVFRPRVKALNLDEWVPPTAGEST